ncbi:MAG: prepilin-type N-terminal cleavage/methylation domain-containing protein, partial [Succinivibrionaceae bacterium]|nr:prepilin-type N-terminal cleavage/methylation domain-containing protein [Succinivibrionaceae bacterium]
MRSNKGFTLIELVVVIVILGILAAVAAPKFMDLQSDARISALQGLQGAVKSAVNLTYAKGVVQGTEKIKD